MMNIALIPLIFNDYYAHHVLRSCSRILKSTQRHFLPSENKKTSPTAAHTHKCARCEGIYAIINFQCSCYAYMWNYVFGRKNAPRTSFEHINPIPHLCARCRYCSALASFMLRAKASERKKLPAICVEIIGRHESKASKKERSGEKHIKF